MKKKYVLKVLFIIALAVVPSLLYLTKKKVTRFPSSERPERVVLAKFSLANEASLILIGLECKTQSSACDDWEKIGFDSIKGQIKSVEPKFLVYKSKNFIEQVYTFEYGATKKRKITKAMEGGKDEILHYMELPENIDAKLPTLLVDVLTAKNLTRSAARFSLDIMNFTPLAVFSRSIQEIVNYSEAKKFFQASYLNRLIEMAILDENFPELIEVFGRNNLLDLGASLRQRFMGSDSDVIASVGVKNKKRADFYEEFIRLRAEAQSVNMSKLATRANEEGLVLIPYSRDLAILYYDPSLLLDKDKYNDLLLNTKLIENIERYQEMTSADKKLVPLGTFLLTDKIAPKKIVDFENPHAALMKEKITHLVTFATDISFSFVDNVGVSTAMMAGIFTGKLVFKKKGIIYGSANIESEAHLQVLLQSEMVKIDSEEVSKDLLSFYLNELDLEENVQKYYTDILNSNDKKEIDQGLKEIILHFQSLETSKRFNHGMGQVYKLSNKIVSWESFKKWIQDDEKKSDLTKLLIGRNKRRAKKGLDRLPSSIQSDAAFVFMVDGLRPDRFREAYKKGLVPNMGKFFIENGLQFNSFAPRSLTLPSWSSILTGLDQDEHGLKSNGPMSREQGKPNENFVDPRKDLLNLGFNRKNRAYKQLKESNEKWLPDFFNESEVQTNYMPVNNQAFPPLGKIFKTALKQFDKILFGNLSATVALDRATALETVSQLKKNPGGTKLFLNWFTCVDIYSHHNNKVLDICYRELDKSFKLIMDQLARDPVMKEAHIFLISDHGHTGGEEDINSVYKLFQKGSYFNNTALNLTTLFAGDYQNYRHFNFSPFVLESPYPDNDLKFLREYQLHPFRVRYKSKNQKEDKPSDVLIDSGGDSLGQIYFKHPVFGWDKRLSYYDLTHFNSRDMFLDLLSVKISNNVNFDSKTRDELAKINHNHPIQMIAHALESCKKEDLENIIGERINELGREPVLVKSLDYDIALILTKKEENKLLYKYFLLSEFEQNENLKCTGKISLEPHDIFGQFNEISGKWLTKMQLLKMTSENNYPTAITSLVGTLTLSEKLAKNKKRIAEIPDLVLIADQGFNFNSSNTSEADHGGLTKKEIKNSFFYGQMGNVFDEKTKKNVLAHPVFNYFLTPFVLETTGRRIPGKLFEEIPSFYELQENH